MVDHSLQQLHLMKELNQAARVFWRKKQQSMAVAARLFVEMVHDIPLQTLKCEVAEAVNQITQGNGAVLLSLDSDKRLKVSGFRLDQEEDLKDALVWLQDVLGGKSSAWAAFAFKHLSIEGDDETEAFLEEGLVWSLSEGRVVGVCPSGDLDFIWEVLENGKITNGLSRTV